MASKYDNIQTAAELIKEVQRNGLSLEQDDINRAADIFGRTSIGELDRLANDIGRNNDKGEPDPNGSWSSNRIATQGTFYAIAFNIWHWEQATRFFNEHTNPDTKGHNVSNLEKRLDTSEKKYEKLLEKSDDQRDELEAALQRESLLQEAYTKLKHENNALKAKLYDLMTDAA